MIELLSRLDPSTSPYIGSMQDSGEKKLSAEDQAKRLAAKNTRCRVCRGRRRVKAPVNELGNRPWETCPSCFGSGVMLAGSQKSSRSRAQPEIMTPEQIAGLTHGMPPEWYRAAVLYITHDSAVRKAVVNDVIERIVEPQSRDWRIGDELKQVRILGVSRVAAASLLLPEGKRIKRELGVSLMCCTESSWQNTWRDRAIDASERAIGWTASADDYMSKQRHAANDEIKEMSA